MSSSVVVGCIFLSCNELLRVEQLSVRSCPNLINNSWLQVDKDSSRNMFPRPGLREEGVKAVVSSPDGLVAGHLTVRLDAVLQAVELPTGIDEIRTGTYRQLFHPEQLVTGK